MDSKHIKYLTEAYSEVYTPSEIDCQDLYDSVLELCILENYFDTLDECEEFAELLVTQDLVEEFLGSLLECYGVEDLETLCESTNYLTERGGQAIRNVINALSKSGRLKAGLPKGSALGKKPESIVKGAAASTSIRSARRARPPASPAEKPGKYMVQQFKKNIETSLKRPALPPAKPTVTPPPTKSTEKGLTYTTRAVLSPAEKAGQQKYPGLAKYDTSGQRRLPTGSENLAASRKRLATVLGATTAGVALAASVADSEKEQRKQQKEIEKTQRQNKPPKQVSGADVRTSFDQAFSDARKRLGSSGTFEWVNPLTKKKGTYNTKYKEESVDIFDDVADVLLSEGYVNTYEDAMVMMSALDEGAIAKMAAGVLKGVIKSGGSKLTKTKLPPKMDPALKFVKDQIKQKFGAGALMGTPEQRYASAARQAELIKNPPPKPKPRDPFPGDVYSRSDFGIRGYRSGD